MLYRLFKAVCCVAVGIIGGSAHAEVYKEKWGSGQAAERQAGVRLASGVIASLALANRRRIPRGPWRWVAAGSLAGAVVAPPVFSYADGTVRDPQLEAVEQGVGAIVGAIVSTVSLLVVFWLRHRKTAA